MAILGLDYGTRRIGVAIAPDDTNFALPLTTVEGDAEEQWKQLDELVQKHTPLFFVVGLPYTAEGTEGEQAAVTREFIAALHTRYNLPVNLIDERMTSQAAAAMGARDIDASSAALILDTYLAQASPEDAFDL